MVSETPHPNTRAQLRAEIDNPLAADFARREKDGVPIANDPRNVRLAMFRVGVHAARAVDGGDIFLVRSGENTLYRLTKDRVADLRMDIHREYGFLPSKALVNDVIHDVSRAYDVVWSPEKGLHLV